MTHAASPERTLDRRLPVPRFAWLLLVVSSVVLSSCVQIAARPGGSAAPNQPGMPTVPAWPPTTGVVAPTVPAPVPATVSSFIAYARDGNIWATSVDGSTTLQLTADGAQEAYANPTVAPDGTVYALRGEDTLYHFDLAGRVIGAPAPIAVLENGGEGLAVAPDGAHIAFVTTGWGTLVDARFGTYAGQYIYGGTDVITPDGRSVPGAALGQMLYPSWANASTLIVSDGTTVYVSDLLSPAPAAWLSAGNGCVIPEVCEPGQEAAANYSEAVINRADTVLAYNYRPFFGEAGRRMLSLQSPPPGEPTVRCLIPGHENYRDPGSFSSDGSMFAFDDTVFDPDSLETKAGQGIYVMHVNLDSADCGASSARLLVAGGFQPDLS